MQERGWSTGKSDFYNFILTQQLQRVQQEGGCLGSNSQGDLEEIPQSVHISTFPIHRTKSTITLTYLKEAGIWLRRVWKELRGA